MSSASFYTGTLSILNKKKNKKKKVIVDIVISGSNHLFLHASVPFVGLSIATLKTSGDQALLVNHLKSEYIKTADSSAVLEKFSKIPLSVRDITHALSGTLDKLSTFKCTKNSSITKCTKGNIKYSYVDEQSYAQIELQTEKAKLNFSIKDSKPMKYNFDIKKPSRRYKRKHIEL